jgi:hypothetical protein
MVIQRPAKSVKPAKKRSQTVVLKNNEEEVELARQVWSL